MYFILTSNGSTPKNNHFKQFRKGCCKTKRGQSNLEWHFHRSNGFEKCQCIVEVCLVPMILWYAIMTKQQTMLAEPFETSRTSKGKSAQCRRCMQMLVYSNHCFTCGTRSSGEGLPRDRIAWCPWSNFRTPKRDDRCFVDPVLLNQDIPHTLCRFYPVEGAPTPAWMIRWNCMDAWWHVPTTNAQAYIRSSKSDHFPEFQSWHNLNYRVFSSM